MRGVFLWLFKRIFAFGPLGRAHLLVENEGGAGAPPIFIHPTSKPPALSRSNIADRI